MKLYATTTSERASKGQGGNEFLEVALTLEGADATITIGTIYLDINEDTKNHGSELDEWVLSWQRLGADDPEIIAQGHIKPKWKGESCEKCKGKYEGNCAYCIARIAQKKTKGNKQKGESLDFDKFAGIIQRYSTPEQ